MTDVCLIYPPSIAFERMGSRLVTQMLPPLGLAYMAGVLLEQGHSVRIIDAIADMMTCDEVFRRVDGRYRVCGFYCNTLNYASVREIAQKLKGSDPSMLLIAGGPHADAMPMEVMGQNSCLDAVIVGEGELTLLEIVERQKQGQTLSGVKGIYHREAGEIVQNDARPLVEDLDRFPLPAYHLLPIRKYRTLIESRGKQAIHILGSRGCANDCNYCYSTKLWSTNVRWHSTERVLDEIDHLREVYGVKFFKFLDDNFTLDKERLKVLMPEFRKRDLSWCCSTRVDLIDDEVVEYLKEGNVQHVAIGIETVNDRLLQVIGKNVTSQQIVKAVRQCVEGDIDVLGMFIMGIPSETRAEVEESIDFACSSGIQLATFSFMTFYPGTNFWHTFKDSQQLSKDFTRYSLASSISYLDPGRTKEEIDQLMKQAMRRFYLRPRKIAALASLVLGNPSQMLEIATGMAKITMRFFIKD